MRLRPRIVQRARDFAIVDQTQLQTIDRRLAVLRRDDDGGVARIDRGGNPAELVVDEVEGTLDHRAGNRAAGRVAAEALYSAVACVVGLIELLRGRDRLEVHAKDRRYARPARAVVIMAARPVDDGLHLELVVELGVQVVLRPIVTTTARNEAVDLRREQVVHTGTGGAVHEVVGSVLVGPGRVQAVRLCHFEHRVDAQV